MTKYLCIAMAGLVTFAGCARTATTPAPIEAPRDRVGYRVRVRWTTLQPSDPIDKLHALIDRNNTKEQRDRELIDPSLNAKLIDPAKVDAFLAALDRLPAATRQALARGTILLEDESLDLDVPSPAIPEDFATLTGFSRLVLDGAYLVLTPTMHVDRTRARALVKRSRDAIAAVNARLAGGDPRQGELARIRFQLAWVWRANLGALVDAATDADRADLTAELAAATQEISGYVVNMGGAGPGEDEGDPGGQGPAPTPPAAHLPQGEPCPSPTCVAPAECIRVVGMDPSTGHDECWMSCANDASVCPAHSQCVMVHDGPGQVCLSSDPD